MPGWRNGVLKEQVGATKKVRSDRSAAQPYAKYGEQEEDNLVHGRRVSPSDE
jgi:hypothetical protein